MLASTAKPPPQLLLLLLLLHCCRSQYLHHSRSPFGPWVPVVPQGCTESTGVWPNGGGNNPSPYIVDAEASALTGLPASTVVVMVQSPPGSGLQESRVGGARRARLESLLAGWWQLNHPSAEHRHQTNQQASLIRFRPR